MGQELGNLHLGMSAGVAKFKRQMKSAETSVGKFEKRIKQTGGKSMKASKGVVNFRQELAKLAGAVGLVVGAAQLIKFLGDARKAFGEATETAGKLGRALINAGQFSIQASRGILEFSSALQLQTRFGDETITSVQTMLIQLGELSAKELPRATRAVLDLAEGTGKTLKEASIAVAKAAQGQTDSLRESGLMIVKTGDKAKDFEKVLKLIEGRFGGQSEEIGNAIAAMAQLENAWADLKETVGRVAVGKAIVAEIKEIIVWWDKLIKITSGVTTLIPGATPAEQGQLDELNKKLAKTDRLLRKVRKNELQFPGPRATSLKLRGESERLALVKQIEALEAAIAKRLDEQNQKSKDRIKREEAAAAFRLEGDTAGVTAAGALLQVWNTLLGRQKEITDEAERQKQIYQTIGAQMGRIADAAGAAAKDALLGGQTVVNNILSGATQGAAVGGPVGAAVGAGVGLLQSSEQFQALMETVGANFQRFADTVGVLIEPFIPLVSVIGQFANAILVASPGLLLMKIALAGLTPLLKILFGVFKTLGLIVLKVAKFFADVIPGISSRKVRDAIKELEETTFDAADANEDLADASKKAADEISNIPTGFKLALERFRARDADAVHGDDGGPGGPTGGGGDNHPGGLRGGKGSNLPGAGGDDDFETTTGAATSSGRGLTLHFHGITDPEAVARKVLEVQEREGLLANGSSGTNMPLSTGQGNR